MQIFADEEPDLESIANNIIEITTDNSKENPIITYNNIEEFVTEVRNQIPNIDDLELANFIVDYTGQEEFDLEDKEALKYLGFKEIIVSDDYIKVDADGNTESMTEDEMTVAMFRDDYGISPLANPWTSPNGYMKTKTIISRETGVVGGYVNYQIVTYAHWLKLPTCFFTDILAIYYESAVFDSEHELYGKLVEQLYCCTTPKKYLSQVWAYGNNNSPYYSEKNVTVENDTGSAAGIKFKLIQRNVFQCKSITTNHISGVNDILTYMSYGISVEAGKKYSVQPAYCHKQVSVGSISLGFSKGGPSFSTSGIVTKKEYIADKITKTAYK